MSDGNGARSQSSPAVHLRRALGKWDLTAIGVNQVIGGAVFAVPASLALSLGAWSWCAVGLVGLLAMAIALNFAEAGSRFEGTGGPYLYARAAFGRFVSFEIGWIGWLIRVTSWASVVNVLVSALGYYWPAMTTGGLRIALISAVILGIMALNVRGIRQSSVVVEHAHHRQADAARAVHRDRTAARVVRGACAPRPGRTWSQVSTAALLLIFVFGGYEIIPVPAGEARDPRTAVPVRHDHHHRHRQRRDDDGAGGGARHVSGPGGVRILDAAGGRGDDLHGRVGRAADDRRHVRVVAGNNVGAALSGSRILFALAEQGDVPRIFGHIHARFRTPDVAIVVTSVVNAGAGACRVRSCSSPRSARSHGCSCTWARARPCSRCGVKAAPRLRFHSGRWCRRSRCWYAPRS